MAFAVGVDTTAELRHPQLDAVVRQRREDEGELTAGECALRLGDDEGTLPAPRIEPRKPRSVLLNNEYCGPLRSMYAEVESGSATSWNQIEDRFLDAMSEFDSNLPVVFSGSDDERKQQSRALSGALQNDKGDWFNNLLAVLLERCSEVETLYLRRQVPGLIIPVHNLDGVFPGEADREIEFLLEAKMMGTPKHANSPNEKAAGRDGSADTKMRVGELAFKGEASRRLTMIGKAPTGGGAGGGDLSTWLHANRPRIYFFMAVRVLSDTDFAAVVRWAQTAAQIVDAVGLYAYEPTPGSHTTYRRRAGVPTAHELERVLYRACIELRGLATEPPPPIPADVEPSPAAQAEELTEQATSQE